MAARRRSQLTADFERNLRKLERQLPAPVRKRLRQLVKSLQDAHERNRHDLVARYTGELGEVVKSTSYTEVIESIKKKSGL